MFMGITLIGPKDEDGNNTEKKAVINTNDIYILSENPSVPGTSLLIMKDDKKNPNLIKGSYEQNAKILFGFNRKI